MSGQTPACSQANMVPVRQKPVAISSTTSRTSCFTAQCRYPPQHRRIVKTSSRPPPAPAVSSMDGGDFIGAARQHAVELFEPSVIARQVDDDLFRKQTMKHRVHPLVRIAHRHRRRSCHRDSRSGSLRKRARPLMPWLSQYCTAIFMAISTDTDPDSEKNTWPRSPGRISDRRRARVSAGSCTKPPSMT